MLNDISVRTFIILFLLITAVALNVVEMIFSATPEIIIGTNAVSIISILCLWWYMTKYLVMPINTVKRSIEEVTSGNLAISIPEFGNNCAGRLILASIVYQVIFQHSLMRSEHPRKRRWRFLNSWRNAAPSFQ